MKLVPVAADPACYVRCCVCGGKYSTAVGIHADLDGPAFLAYYCPRCAEEARS